MFGYKEIIQNVDLSKARTEDFALEASVKELNEVIVTGTSKATEIRTDPVPIAVISNTEIQQNNNTNIIESLNSVSGLNHFNTRSKCF